jgi:2-isopropylmalate synthase
MVSSITGFPVQYNKAIVGKNAFAHESGIHQDGMLKNAQTYEIMNPEDVGVPSTSLIMGKLSGRNAFRDKLKSLGYELEQPALNDAFRRFKDLADRKKHVFDEDIIALVDDQLAGVQERISLKRLKVVAGTDGPQTAEIELVIEGRASSAESTGNGPVDAVFNAIRSLVPHGALLELYQVNAVTEGTDAQATVSVRLSEAGLVATGKASDPDTLVASARAYVHALNKLEVRRSKAMPQT